MRRFLASFLETIEVAFVAVVSVLIIRTFLIQPFLVNGESMEPNFSDGNYLLVDELSYRLREPERGEVIVFRYPGNEAIFYIKRIIGLPGEKVVVNGGEVKIFNKENSGGFTLSESYLPITDKTYGNLEITLKSDQYFVLGDNRSFSYDSRSWGTLAKNEIMGMVRLKLWPINKAEAVGTPNY
ncbi:MAG: signal peptidase I [Candidatus Liptonbacteria bacterium RIFOXYC1_FULL_36_8]|uniref:Signal peptidase I n=3 Tax=Candidatus Liptoniibacteriota TaxID=1817909 RepID=A0A1G2CMR5_9BACT|nr:MAG: signal peptidase I [Candidatus Liptonbacteria bacterium RIFOXYB1_FULL_36_10]OGZ03963.1 MAG: signal peptidase I [Candidatus Liptonbacteria bacterium RIFOXYC1_FULL_36_8]OGZ04370.1 MAG: signal peptidase I [Candidatus Liptonbacteria bacterium RIFOXYD1_FULL_36_11]